MSYDPWELAEWEHEHYARYGDAPATESEAHAEWHWNSGIPMGTPGCPWDACHNDDYEPAYDAVIGLFADPGVPTWEPLRELPVWLGGPPQLTLAGVPDDDDLPF